ncbi:MAG TPA: SRPBCC family protein [Coriobacteriia bacterium]|nr:SRPBCC family protein [Coriobacteriia bacterium]
MLFRASILIAREPAAVFEQLADFASHGSWREDVVYSRAPRDLRPGSTVLQRVSLHGHEAEVALEVTEFDPPRRIAFRASGAAAARGGFRLAPEAGGTRVTASAFVDLPGSAVLAEERIREAAEQSVRRSLARLKERLETEP